MDANVKRFILLGVFLHALTSLSVQEGETGTDKDEDKDSSTKTHEQDPERHSLYYIYTALSKPVDLPGIYKFSAMGLLDDIQFDYYDSKEQKKIPKQDWIKEKMPQDYWEKGTQSRKSKEQWFDVNVNILIDRMRLNYSDVHVLQWRHGCEIEKQGNKMVFAKAINEYGFDGEDFLFFDNTNSQWVSNVDAALPTKRKWDNVPILNQYTKGYLEKECVDWLSKFRDYRDEQLGKGSPPKVYVFARKASSDKNILKLSCLATGFYPKDVMLTIRKHRMSLPDNETESTGVRPNHDGTFQLQKSVEIKENEEGYDCVVSHKTKEPIISEWGMLKERVDLILKAGVSGPVPVVPLSCRVWL